jgi:EAL domain-containing protein (putative c-di-GMP-specific phosphodiesterase class I)
VIENHPLAVDIGEWVIDTAMAQIEIWKTAGLDIPISVNIGARQLQQTNFVERLCEMLAAHPTVREGDLEMEVLETSAMEDLTKVSGIIEASRNIGVSFALDDFGTGYSSLTYLKRLPVSQIKIDQSFVQGMLDDPDDRAILEGVLGLATAFRLQVIAEGVETTEHGTLLLQFGCDLAQGYGIARPMSPDLLPGWSATWQPDPVWVGLPSFSRDDLPLLFASFEHRDWIVAMEKYLNGGCEPSSQPLNNHQCRFGQWLDTEGLARYGTQPAFAVIERLHQQAHELAPELCKLHNQNDNPEAALARLEGFHFLRDALLEQLKALVQVSRKKEEKGA